MLIAGLVLNILVLVPVLVWILNGGSNVERAFGPATPARGILGCVYGAILAASGGLLALHSMSDAWALPMTVALFGLQIMYKLATVAVVGPRNPVVLSNLLIALFLIASLANLAVDQPLGPQ